MTMRRTALALVAVAFAACQSAPAAPSASPLATAAPTPGTAASPAPAATPAAATATAVLDGLRAFAADEARTFRVTFEGVSRHTTDILDVKGTLDVSGEDAAIGATFRFPREGTGRTDYRRVGGTDWIRFDKGDWRKLRGPDEAAMVDPFAGTHDGTHLQYLGPVDGEPGHYGVQLTAMYVHPALIPAGNLTDEDVTKTKLILVTDDQGRPVSGTWTMRGKGRVSGQLQAVSIDLELAFSKVGAPITIREP